MEINSKLYKNSWFNTNHWDNLSKIVYKRTYARNILDKSGKVIRKENWKETVLRVVYGNVKNFRHLVSDEEISDLIYYISQIKSIPAGRSLWFSGTESHEKLQGAGLVNCWFFAIDNWEVISYIMDLLMLGGGVGFSVEKEFISKLPKIKHNVVIEHRNTKDADFIVPDKREGWVELIYKVLESFFKTGKSFTYSTICLRSKGEPIKGFGGTASGSLPLIKAVNNIYKILSRIEGKHPKSVDIVDIICSIAEMVVAGNVRRSSLLALGDPWDKDFLKAKRWDLHILPSYRAMANFSVVCDDIEDLHPLYWQTYKSGEAFGIVNRTNIQKYGRIGEHKKDNAIGVNPCGEITLENGEPCNLVEHFLPHFSDVRDFEKGARLLHRYAKRVAMHKYHIEMCDKVVKKNMRIGHGITGCLESNLFDKDILDYVYKAILQEDEEISSLYNVPKSVKVTTVKPSGTLSLLGDVSPGIHPYYSRYYIRRVRFSSDDPLVELLREAGHHVEQQILLDGTYDPNTLVVDFYKKAPEGSIVADEINTFEQLEIVKKAQKYWSDNSVSVTVYYKDEDIGKIKDWLRDNLKEIKTVSFLKYTEHGFKQAPLERISEEEYYKNIEKIKPINIDDIGNDYEIKDSFECDGGHCPIK
ncbi:MAG: adenosylcobalamin-dependent ribonucleoside-triphosphate reductase [Candidatus Sericytochromatia bacterium]|nr:MAG: adenosylcobalamin-dependent ribonucleoside-triphosphate reductase [Candidatus Sericytochromatia bacterium]